MSSRSPSYRRPSAPSRRQVLLLGLASGLHTAVAADGEVPALLRQGGVVVVMRHALAPGTFDPPEFRLGDCSSQRLLSDEGRAQARRIGTWFATRQLKPRQVRSSPWCRCMDTATLAFAQTEAWPALGSPHGRSDADKALAQKSLRDALDRVLPGGFEVWVTHSFVIDALVGVSSASGQAFVVRKGPAGAPEVLADLNI